MLDDGALDRLRLAADLPDLTATRYEVIRRLARGGMGTVYLVKDTELGREVALKVLSAPDPSGHLSARLQAEARHLARLEHPNIVPVHDVGRLPDGRVFYVMKLVRGRRLDEWRLEGMTRPALLRLFQNVCGAVAFAHAQGVIHRDLKPENIMVGPFGEALVMDWGVAKLLGEARGERVRDASSASVIEASVPPGSSSAPGALNHGITAQGMVIGTPAYMAPEQARGEVDRLDPRSDVYALGSILYFLLAGRPPFDGTSPEEVLRQVIAGQPEPLRRIDPGIPKALAAICATAMAGEPSSRYESTQQMAEDMDRYLDGLPVLAHRETLLERAARFLGRNRTLLWLVVAYLVVRLVVLLAAGR